MHTYSIGFEVGMSDLFIITVRATSPETAVGRALAWLCRNGFEVEAVPPSVWTDA